MESLAASGLVDNKCLRIIDWYNWYQWYKVRLDGCQSWGMPKNSDLTLSISMQTNFNIFVEDTNIREIVAQ